MSLIKGSLWSAEGGGERRLVIVMGIDQDVCQISLLSNFYEAATDYDLLITPAEAKTPYPILFQADIEGPVLLGQLLAQVGQVKPPLFGLLLQASRGEFSPALTSRRGLPLRSRREARWKLKQAEVEVVHRLGALWYEQFFADA